MRREGVPTLDGRFNVNKPILMFEPIAFHIFNGDESAGRLNLSIHRIFIEVSIENYSNI